MISTRRLWGAALLLALTLGISPAWAKNPLVPLTRAHAHNDYLHPRPLLDALDQGFCSVEADIYLVDGKLLVAHNREDVRPDRTLESLYLEPLQARVRANEGRVYIGGPAFTLLVDIKDDAEATYRVLKDVLSRYQPMLSRFDQDRVTPGAVTVVLSGNRPKATLAAEKSRLATLDGRLDDLGKGVSPAVMALVSDNWQLSFKWRGTGDIPPDDHARLVALVARAHREGYRLRFWATPDTPAAWAELRHVGVDLINTDELRGLGEFLRTPASGAEVDR